MNQPKLYINKLLENGNELFHLLDELNNEFREHINKAFILFEQRCFEQKILLSSIQYAKYALAAFLDELALTHHWEGREAWRKRTLQLEFFGEHLAGENYFKRLIELRQDPIKNIDVIEIYYVCLQLGFEGNYRNGRIEKLKALQVDLRDQIEIMRQQVDTTLAISGLPKSNIVVRIGREIPMWVIICIAVATMFFIYVGYSCAIDYVANRALQKINLSNQLLKKELHVIKQS